MEDKNKIYLDNVVDLIVNGARIDYDRNEIQNPSVHPTIYFFTRPTPTPFYNYCKDVYGLTDTEIEYVWGKYKTIILDKIKNKL
jgi:hypothetical protein